MNTKNTIVVDLMMIFTLALMPLIATTHAHAETKQMAAILEQLHANYAQCVAQANKDHITRFRGGAEQSADIKVTWTEKNMSELLSALKQNLLGCEKNHQESIDLMKMGINLVKTTPVPQNN